MNTSGDTVNSASLKTAILHITPETGRLSAEMGPLARYISGKSGGLGGAVAALCEGLTRRGVPCHLATLNLKNRFRRENGLDEDSWCQIEHRIDSGRIHLASSSFFSHLDDAYDRDPLQTASEFQRQLVGTIIKDVRARSNGRLIIHSHDWMAGGIVTAYAKHRNIPVLHTIYNVHTGKLTLDMLAGVEIDRLVPYLFISYDNGSCAVDCQATAIKSASLISLVGHRFLREVMDNDFLDQAILSPSFRQEIKEKYLHGCTMTVLNAPSPSLYPENCEHLVRNYGPEDDVLAAKRENLVAFQKRTGLNHNPEAILLYWPSRLDPSQKGIHLLEAIAHRFVVEHGDVQIAIIGNGVGNNRNHEEICGRIAWSSGGKITYQRFNESLSMLGFAAASNVFGASLYEPCGQIDQIGNIHGATATNRDTGGYRDKIREMSLMIDGAPEDVGNGFLFRDYDPGGLWYGLSRTVEFHRRPAPIRERQIRRIMRESPHNHNIDRMVEQYMGDYEMLNGGTPLVSESVGA